MDNQEVQRIRLRSAVPIQPVALDTNQNTIKDIRLNGVMPVQIVDNTATVQQIRDIRMNGVVPVQIIDGRPVNTAIVPIPFPTNSAVNVGSLLGAFRVAYIPTFNMVNRSLSVSTDNITFTQIGSSGANGEMFFTSTPNGQVTVRFTANAGVTHIGTSIWVRIGNNIGTTATAQVLR